MKQNSEHKQSVDCKNKAFLNFPDSLIMLGVSPFPMGPLKNKQNSYHIQVSFKILKFLPYMHIAL